MIIGESCSRRFAMDCEKSLSGSNEGGEVGGFGNDRSY